MYQPANLVNSSLMVLNDRIRAVAAAVCEVQGSYALPKRMMAIEQGEVGEGVLTERPIVDESISEQADKMMR